MWSTPQRKFKAKLHSEHAGVDFRSLTPVQLQTLTGNRSVVKWLAESEDFAEWLFNPDHNKQLLEAGVESAINALLEIIEDPEHRQRVAAADKLLAYAGYTPTSKREVTYRDADIAKMTEAELKDFIAQNLGVVDGVQTEDDTDPRH